jgi:hypothetical protein
MQSRRQVVLGLGLLFAGGCDRNGRGGRVSASSRELESVLIRNVPHVRQKPDFCGEAVAASFAQAIGARYEQDDVFDLSEMDPARGMGATTRELKTALERMGFDTGAVWYEVSAAESASELRAVFDELHADLERGVPSIVCMHYDERPNTTEHFRLVLGYDRASERVVYHEPAEDGGAYRTMPLRRFLELWPLKYDRERWTVIRFRLDGRKLAELPPPAGTRPAEFAQHVMALKKRLPQGFHVVVEPPFVVTGDDTPARVEAHASGVVRWAVRMLEREYFTRRPEILEIWLFKDAAGYDAHVTRLFAGSPDTPFGFYSKHYGALVMNIATGGGTLVHEIVHPYIEANFPDCPPWFNEGLGSLYEQSAERGGRIVGLTNWRLAGLKRAIRERRTLPFRTLMEKSVDEFYGDETGLHYAESRYLLYYLQEQGLLQRYYTEFVKNRASDRAGYRTLGEVLAERDLAAFQKRWQSFVLGLRFP